MPQQGRFYGTDRKELSVEEVIVWLNRRNWAMQRHIYVAIQALKKQVPQKAIVVSGRFSNCPSCNRGNVCGKNYCDHCGQRLE